MPSTWPLDGFEGSVGSSSVYCACSSEIGTCIINYAGRQAVHKKTQRKYTFLGSNLAKRRFIPMFWRFILTFNAEKKLSKKVTKLTDTYPFSDITDLFKYTSEWFKDTLYWPVEKSIPKNNDADDR